MKQNKKAQMNIQSMVLLGVLAVSFFIIVIPIIASSTEDGTLQCTNTTLPFFNETSSLCLINNTAGQSVNGTQTFVDTLTAREKAVMGLLGIFLILGLVIVILKSTGIIGKK